MNMTQSLSDIQTMLAYIKEVLEEQDAEGQTQKLDNVGEDTLSIINSIADMNTSLVDMQDSILPKHQEILESNADITKEALDDLVQKIHNNEDIQQRTHADIKDIFERYEKSVSKVMSHMTENKKYQQEAIGDINNDIDTINTNIHDINAKVLSSDDVAELVSGMEEQLQMIAETDKEVSAENQTLLTSLNEKMGTAKDLMQASSEELQTIKEMYTESNSRLSTVDMKIDAMTKHITEEG